jgi:hypothetical protein
MTARDSMQKAWTRFAESREFGASMVDCDRTENASSRDGYELATSASDEGRLADLKV